MQYAEAVKGNKGHTMGPPFVYTYGGLIDGLIRLHGIEVGKSNLDKLKFLEEQFKSMEPPQICQGVVTMCRVSKVFDKEQRRITVAKVEKESLWVLSAALEQVGFTKKLGRAPASHMEREMQSHLDTLLKE